MRQETTRGQNSLDLQAHLDSMPGAIGTPLTAPRGSSPLVLIYKVSGKIFAILALRGEDNVILKCDPCMADLLRNQYTGVGHRSHLDRRFWISVDLVADVPIDEILTLTEQSYALVCAGLTLKQRAHIAALKKDGGP